MHISLCLSWILLCSWWGRRGGAQAQTKTPGQQVIQRVLSLLLVVSLTVSIPPPAPPGQTCFIFWAPYCSFASIFKNWTHHLPPKHIHPFLQPERAFSYMNCSLGRSVPVVCRIKPSAVPFPTPPAPPAAGLSLLLPSSCLVKPLSQAPSPSRSVGFVSAQLNTRHTVASALQGVRSRWVGEKTLQMTGVGGAHVSPESRANQDFQLVRLS